MIRFSVLSLLLSLGLACGGGSKDAETTPAETAPAETAPAEAAPAETTPAETTPAGPTAADQVAQGEKVYGDSCVSCHGPAGEGKGKKSPAVIGPKALGKYKNAADLEKYIKEKMPKDDPGTLSDADAWAVTAWIVSKNGKLGDAALTAENAAGISIH